MIMKKIALVLVSALITASAAFAQDIQKQNIVDHMSVDGRFGYEYQGWDGMVSNDNTGFKGKYLYLMMAGQISDNINYTYRQRLDQIGSVPFFDATEILNLTWSATKNLHISAGKQLVALGGFEYNTAPINLYYNSQFWCTFAPYQLGLSVDYNITKNDNLLLQVNNSSFRYTSNNNTYGLNLMWTGHHGFYDAYWSVNMTQYRTNVSADKQWMNFIVLGNRFNFMPSMYLSVDFVNRTSTDDFKVANDYSVSSELSVKPVRGVRAFAKYTRDFNKDYAEDLCIPTGTDINTASVGLEYEPQKSKIGDFRLYATGMYSWGDNQKNFEDAVYNEKETRIEAGIKFSLDVLGALKK